jgi:lysozyme family protein
LPQTVFLKNPEEIMSEANFADALRRLLVHEGGYSNHPADPGGPTKYGITIGDYRRYIHPNATAADVKAMGVDAAGKIYRKHYWDVMRCDELPSGVDYAVFDYAVNSGVARGGKVLRRVLGLGAGNAAVTAAVVEAAAKQPAREIVAAICDERLRFLRSLKTWPTFGAGWGRRVAEVRTAALALARKTPVKAAPPKPTGKAEAAISISILSTAAAAVAAWMQSPVFWVGILLAAAVIAAGVFWFFFHHRRDREHHDQRLD